MKNVQLVIIAIHGLIHLLGFFKAFNLVEIKELTKSTTQTEGILWLAATILILVFVVTYGFNHNYWWVIGLIAILISQGLIISSWSDAKFGTLVNILILVLIFMNFYKSI